MALPWKKKRHTSAERSYRFHRWLAHLGCPGRKVTLFEMIVQRFVIPKEERWLYKNKEALASVLRGLSQRGTTDRGSFV